MPSMLSPASARTPVNPSGYVICSPNNVGPVPVFQSPCDSSPVSSLQCGSKVEVIGREGPWLHIRSSNGSDQYLGAASVSATKKRFIPVKTSGIPDTGARTCPIPRPKLPPTHLPVALYSPDPAYPKTGLADKLEGYVGLAVTIDKDGQVQHAEVTKSLRSDFDEVALRTVRQWKFEPAAKDGVPITAKIPVQVTFRLY